MHRWRLNAPGSGLHRAAARIGAGLCQLSSARPAAKVAKLASYDFSPATEPGNVHPCLLHGSTHPPCHPGRRAQRPLASRQLVPARAPSPRGWQRRSAGRAERTARALARAASSSRRASPVGFSPPGLIGRPIFRLSSFWGSGWATGTRRGASHPHDGGGFAPNVYGASGCRARKKLAAFVLLLDRVEQGRRRRRRAVSVRVSAPVRRITNWPRAAAGPSNFLLPCPVGRLLVHVKRPGDGSRPDRAATSPYAMAKRAVGNDEPKTRRPRWPPSVSPPGSITRPPSLRIASSCRSAPRDSGSVRRVSEGSGLFVYRAPQC